MKKILLIMTAALLYIGSAWATDYCNTNITFSNGSVCSLTVYKSGEMTSTIELRSVSGANLVSVQTGSCLQLHSFDYSYDGWNDIAPFSESSGVFTKTLTWNKKFPKWSDNIGDGVNNGSKMYIYCKFEGDNNYGNCYVEHINWEAVCAAPEPAISLTLTPNNKKINAQWVISNFTPTAQSLSYSADGDIWTAVAVEIGEREKTITGLKNDVTYQVKVTASDGAGTEIEDIESATPTLSEPIAITGVSIGNDLWTLTIDGVFDKSHEFTLVADGNNPYVLTFERYAPDNNSLIFKCNKDGSTKLPSGTYYFSLNDVTEGKCSKLEFTCTADTRIDQGSLTYNGFSSCYVPETEKEFTFTRRIEKQKVLAIKSNATISRIEITNAAGKLVKEQDFDHTVTDVNVKIGQYDLGTYTVKIYDASGTTPENIKVLTAVY